MTVQYDMNAIGAPPPVRDAIALWLQHSIGDVGHTDPLAWKPNDDDWDDVERPISQWLLYSAGAPAGVWCEIINYT